MRFSASLRTWAGSGVLVVEQPQELSFQRHDVVLQMVDALLHRHLLPPHAGAVSWLLLVTASAP